MNVDREPQPIYYLARGRAHACMSMFEEAMNDLSDAIKLDEGLQAAYAYLG